jgi:hypothetical protein
MVKKLTEEEIELKRYISTRPTSLAGTAFKQFLYAVFDFARLFEQSGTLLKEKPKPWKSIRNRSVIESLQDEFGINATIVDQGWDHQAEESKNYQESGIIYHLRDLKSKWESIADQCWERLQQIRSTLPRKMRGQQAEESKPNKPQKDAKNYQINKTQMRSMIRDFDLRAVFEIFVCKYAEKYKCRGDSERGDSYREDSYRRGRTAAISNFLVSFCLPKLPKKPKLPKEDPIKVADSFLTVTEETEVTEGRSNKD